VKGKQTIAWVLAIIMCVMMAGLATAGDKKQKVEIAYVEWACATASSNVAKAVIQEKLVYKCELTPVSAAAMFQALAIGDVDAMTTAWLPVTHEDYLAKVKDNVVDLGPNLHGARLGLVVPTYVSIDSIDQLNEYAEEFKGKIIGIDPGAGMMKTTETVLVDYKLDKFELMESSGAMMTAVLGNAIKKKEWVVVTGWAPHWKFGRWDLKILDDPKGLYGSEETINTLVRKGLDTDMPDVYKFLDNFNWTTAEIGQVMVWIQDGMDEYEAAKKWVTENPDKVNAWLK